MLTPPHGRVFKSYIGNANLLAAFKFNYIGDADTSPIVVEWIS